jgi:hypothetical protein
MFGIQFQVLCLVLFGNFASDVYNPGMTAVGAALSLTGGHMAFISTCNSGEGGEDAADKMAEMFVPGQAGCI